MPGIMIAPVMPGTATWGMHLSRSTNLHHQPQGRHLPFGRLWQCAVHMFFLSDFQRSWGSPAMIPASSGCRTASPSAQTEGVRQTEFQIFALQRIPRTGPIHNALRTLDLMPRAMWT